jgi:hypothetical protein
MPHLKRLLTAGVLGTAVVAGALAITSTAASAFVACNAAGECWHVRERYVYPNPSGVVMHDDGWVFDRPGFYRWVHDHPGRGYWVKGHWHRF